jgi:3,4-dihydroxy 2-butanone 4-phosphate synthase/GTP cyclohydrolase II
MENPAMNPLDLVPDIPAAPDAFTLATDELAAGRMVLLRDDRERQGEGDLLIAAEFADAAAINFMVTEARGIVCVALSTERCAELGLEQIGNRGNQSSLGDSARVSIEAKDGVTTGISAPDRARTIAVAIDPTKGPDDLVTPGHVFPLMARDGGVLVRTGHTEAAVDIARLAGLNPSGVICEIMNDDGTMARRPELIAFAQLHGLKVATIADLIAYRLRHDRIVERKIETNFTSRFGGEWKLHIYASKTPYAEHIALVKGDIAKSGPVMTRMHAINMLDDAFGNSGNRAGILRAAMLMIAKEGRGVVIAIREPTLTILSDRVRNMMQGESFVPALRDYGIGAQILLDLGVHEMILLSNTERTIVALEGYGLNAVERRAIAAPEG